MWAAVAQIGAAWPGIRGLDLLDSGSSPFLDCPALRNVLPLPSLQSEKPMGWPNLTSAQATYLHPSSVQMLLPALALCHFQTRMRTDVTCSPQCRADANCLHWPRAPLDRTLSGLSIEPCALLLCFPNMVPGAISCAFE